MGVEFTNTYGDISESFSDKIFLNKMDKQHRSYSDDEEHGYISQKTGIDTKLIEEIPNEDFADM